jgi:hypothetical protein
MSDFSRWVDEETKAHYNNYEEWLNAALKAYHTTTHEQRLGQWLFNSLHYIRRDLTDAIQSMDEVNPFYINQKIGAFLKYVERNWERK